MSLAERIRISRKEKGYSQEELAERLNVSRQTVTKWETENAYPEMKTLLLLSVILEKDLDWLFSDDLFAVRVQNNQILLEQEKEKVMVRQSSSVNRMSRQLVNAALGELQLTDKRTVTKSGYRFIDDGRGWINQVYVLYGIPAIGKTALAMNIVNNLIRKEGHIAYYDLSRPAKETMKKLLGIAANVSIVLDKEYSRGEKSRLEKAGELLRNSYLYMEHVYEDPIEKIHEKCLNIDPYLDLIVIDGAEHLTSAKPVTAGQENEYWVNQELQEMVRNCHCPILLLKEPSGQMKTVHGEEMSVEMLFRQFEAADQTDGEIWLFHSEEYESAEGKGQRAALIMKKRFAEGNPYMTGAMDFEPETLQLKEIRVG